MNRFLGILILSIVVLLAGFFYYRYYYVFGEGVKSGELNFVVKKGYLFKTYEGKLIQSGFKSKVAGTIQSNEFDFSVTNERIAKQLMLSSGKEVDLHYREYLHAIPWRGYNKYVVDSIIAIREIR
jgi:hypothetical protein